jgi:hypothetical protein
MESTQVINGVGLPRIIVVKEAIYTSAGATTYTSTSVIEAGTPDLSALRVGHRITSFVVIGGDKPNKPVFGKVTAIDDVNDIISVDSWIGGTPTNGQVFVIDGFVIDLPRCQEMTEIFTPDQLIHKLRRSRTETKFYGWGYQCILDYSTYATGDMFYDLLPAFNLKQDDRLILIPRRDAPRFQYNVYYAESISLSLYGKTPGYRKPVFVFQGAENVATWRMVKLGYGTHFGTDYGSTGW